MSVQPFENEMRPATAKRRREILDAALECFLENGVESTSIEEIRNKSGASHGSIYHLFPSKSDIAATLYVEGVYAYQQLVVEAIQKASTAQEKIKTFIHTHLEYSFNDPRLSIYLTRQATANLDLAPYCEQHAVLKNEFFDTVYAEFKQFIDRNETKNLSRELYFAIITGPCILLTRDWIMRPTDFDLMQYTDQLAEAAWQSLACSQDS